MTRFRATEIENLFTLVSLSHNSYGEKKETNITAVNHQKLRVFNSQLLVAGSRSMLIYT
jgi:hypothetical protein